MRREPVYQRACSGVLLLDVSQGMASSCNGRG